MRATRLGFAILILGGLLGLTYFLGGVLGGLLFDWDDDGGDNDRVFWVVVLISAAVLLLAGLLVANRSRWAAAALVSIGALAGAVVIFWSIVIPLAAIALVVLSILWARQRPAAVP